MRILQPLKILKNQIIATTHIDKSSKKLSQKDIQSLFDSMSENIFCSNEHDISRCPTCRLYNKRLVQLDDGEFAIEADCELFDNFNFNKTGFSIGYSPKKDISNISFDVALNPDRFTKKQLAALKKMLQHRNDLSLTELKQKGVTTHTIIQLIMILPAYSVIRITDGFLGVLGADLYKKFKAWISKCNKEIQKESRDVKLIINIKESASRNLILTFSTPDMEYVFESITIKDLLDIIANTSITNFSKAVIEYKNNKLSINYIIGTDGKIYIV